MLPLTSLLKNSTKAAFLLTFVAMLTTGGHAATMLTYTVETITNTGTVTETSPPESGDISSTQTFSTEKGKEGTIQASAQELVDTGVDGNISYIYAGAAPFGIAEATISPTNGGNGLITTVAAKTTFTVTFNLASNEGAQVNFDLTYTIVSNDSNFPSQVSWDLKLEGASLGLSGSDTNTGSASQSITIDPVGTLRTYILTMTAEVPAQTFTTPNQQALASLDTVTFNVAVSAAVPEPSSTALLALSLSGALFLRRR